MLHSYVFRRYLKFIRNGIILWMLEPTTYCGVLFTAPTSQITLNLGLKTILMQLSLQWPQLASWLNWWSGAPLSRRSRARIPYKPGFFFRLSFRNCGSCVCNCDSLLSYHSSARSSWFPSIHDFNDIIITPFDYLLGTEELSDVTEIFSWPGKLPRLELDKRVPG